MPAVVQVWIDESSLALGWFELGQASDSGALGPGVAEAEQDQHGPETDGGDSPPQTS